MKKINFLAILIAGLTALMFFTACSDEEPEYDSANPLVGTWVVDEISGFSYDNYFGALELYEGETEQRFRKKWIGKSIKFGKKTVMDGDRVVISEHDTSLTDSEDEIYTIVSVDETTLVADYYFMTYHNDKRFSKYTCTFSCHRK